MQEILAEEYHECKDGNENEISKKVKETTKEITPADLWYCINEEINSTYIPAKEEIEKDGTEFFPKMVSNTCKGYFRIWDTKYADEVRKLSVKVKNLNFTSILV